MTVISRAPTHPTARSRDELKSTWASTKEGTLRNRQSIALYFETAMRFQERRRKIRMGCEGRKTPLLMVRKEKERLTNPQVSTPAGWGLHVPWFGDTFISGSWKRRCRSLTWVYWLVGMVYNFIFITSQIFPAVTNDFLFHLFSFPAYLSVSCGWAGRRWH